MAESNLELVGSFRDIVLTATDSFGTRSGGTRSLDIPLPNLTVSLIAYQEVCLVRLIPDEITVIDLASLAINDEGISQSTTFRDRDAEQAILKPHADNVSIAKTLEDVESLRAARLIALSPHTAALAIAQLTHLSEEELEIKAAWKEANTAAKKAHLDGLIALEDFRRDETERVLGLYPPRRPMGMSL